MNYKMVGYLLGWLLLFEALFLCVPVLTGIYYGEKELWAFLVTAIVCAAVGRIMTSKKPKRSELYSREGFVVVSLSWIVLSICSAIPYYISGAIPSVVDALFESVSGLTTTGASAVQNVDVLPKSVLIWRSFTHWIGGMGVLVFIMAFIPLSGGQNMYLMKAESPGPSVGKLVPRVKTTAFLLYTMYFVLTFLEFVLLLCGRMGVFEAMNVAFSTAGTGGFSIKGSSMSEASPYLQVVVTVFMILFSINFNSYFFLLKGKIKDALTSEVKIFLLIVGTSIAIITINISGMFPSIKDALRHAAFSVATIISTTGFSTTDFNMWPELSRSLLVILMFVGACAGSTGGGIKVSRIMILVKSMSKELHQLIHPKQVQKIKMDSQKVEHDVIRSVNVYMVCFMMVFVSSIILVSFDNLDLITNFTAVTATINNIGVGLEKCGPAGGFYAFSPFFKLVLIFDMLAGRLELFPVLLLFVPATWKKN